MPAVLNTNAASLYASKNLQSAQSKMATSVERLSSGLRVNRAKDDAAGLGISNSLTTQINSANQGIRNLNDGISMVQAAEGAIAAAQEMGQRILTLATQAANGTLGVTDRTAIVSEMRQLLTAINTISARTKFSGNDLLLADSDATATLFTLQSSNNTSDTITMASNAFRNIGIGKVSTTLQTGSTGVTLASTLVKGQASELTHAVNGAKLTATTGATAAEVLTAAQLVQTEAGNYINALSTQRSLLGAYQNQIEYTVSNLTELSANLAAAKSNVVDTDYATETAALTKGQILQQAATAMLAQANQMPNVILSLLK
jgi:flagellin